MTGCADCPWCGREETTLHALRDCEPIPQIWLALAGNNLPSDFFSVHANVGRDLEWDLKFAFMAWFTWKCRNILVFKGRDSMMTLSKHVTLQHLAYINARVLSKQSTHVAPSPLASQPMGWTRPLAGWMKLNVDAHTKGNSGDNRGGDIFYYENGTFV
ncbi:hypothetical protein V2J09_022555 [Rumex salicifolius]